MRERQAKPRVRFTLHPDEEGTERAIMFLTTLSLPAAPLLAWSLMGGVTVGLILLGALAESRLRRGWKKRGKTTLH
jgi:hypothetical protein